MNLCNPCNIACQEVVAMPTKKTIAPTPGRPINFSVRLSSEDAKRVEALAAAHDWTLGKTIAKIVALALDAGLLK